MFYCNSIKSPFIIKETFTFYLGFILSNLFSGIFSWLLLSHNSSDLGLSLLCLITNITFFFVNQFWHPKLYFVVSIATGSIYFHDVVMGGTSLFSSLVYILDV